jgi:hypothetical protein
MSQCSPEIDRMGAMMAGRLRKTGRLRTVAGTVAAIGAGVLLAPVAGLAGCASNAAPAAASHAAGGTATPAPGLGEDPRQRNESVTGDYRPPMSSLQTSG